MIPEKIREALRRYREGTLDQQEMEGLLETLPFQDLGFAKVDHHRVLRHGFTEVIFGQGKTEAQVLDIADAILAKSPNLLATRVNATVAERLRAKHPECRYHELCRAVSIVREETHYGRGKVGVFSAGTADGAVAEEAAVTAEVMGNEVVSCYDVGVAGLHRILSQMESLRSCSVIIAVAGMEGALPSVIGGLVDAPVIAVPTSIGYGAAFGGLAALLGMLNSCASNVTVVNIDNGFGAGYVASLVNRRRDFDQS
jgi:NCAIR mutase (PurE)-related protein